MLVIISKPYYLQESSTEIQATQKKFANGSGCVKLPIGRLSSNSKGHMKQNLHPRMLSTQDRATAHTACLINKIGYAQQLIVHFLSCSIVSVKVMEYN